MAISIEIGIDLGTSNSALYYAHGPDTPIEHIPINQYFDHKTIGIGSILPSFLYIPTTPDRELLKQNEDQLAMEDEMIVGEWAKARSLETPLRVVSSAKSWLCYSSLDRSKKNLPLGADNDLQISPIEASTRILSYLKTQLDGHFSKKNKIIDYSKSHLTLTVPASFDEVARQLTLTAADRAGFKKVSLLEEPQAAFYGWLHTHREEWKNLITQGDLVLVCDIGGGTTDFSLIGVSESESGNMELVRLAVGPHLLLGGDNMDLALAYYLRSKIEEENASEVNDSQFESLKALSRKTKEELLSGQKDSTQISIAGPGSSLFTSTLTVSVTQKEVEEFVEDGFFPQIDRDTLPSQEDQHAIGEHGLPYEKDPAIVKHLLSFLKGAAHQISNNPNISTGEKSTWLDEQDLKVTKILFNGGVFQASRFKKRIMNNLSHWLKNSPEELKSDALDLAVAQGACSFGLIKNHSNGLRITAGTSHSYYLGIEESMPAIPGVRPKLHGLCIVPLGTEEGAHIDLEDKTFSLQTGKTVDFRFFTSETRSQDQLGDLVKNAPKNLHEVDRLTLTLDRGNSQDATIPVKIHAHIDETGILNLSMRDVDSGKSWDLQYKVRQNV